PPHPNPSHGATSFRFALSTAGRARAEVFDVRGRRVATVLDRDLGAGAWDAAWDGKDGGSLAAPGVYYLRLQLPGPIPGRTIVGARYATPARGSPPRAGANRAANAAAPGAPEHRTPAFHPLAVQRAPAGPRFALTRLR